MVPPFAGRGGAVSGPKSRRFIFPGGGLGAHFRVPVLPAGKFDQGKGDGTRPDSVMPGTSGVRPAWSHISGLGLRRKPEHLGTALPPSQYDLPGNFPIFREDSQFKLYLQGFLYTNHMEKLAKGRIVAR